MGMTYVPSFPNFSASVTLLAFGANYKPPCSDGHCVSRDTHGVLLVDEMSKDLYNALSSLPTRVMHYLHSESNEK